MGKLRRFGRGSKTIVGMMRPDEHSKNDAVKGFADRGDPPLKPGNNPLISFQFIFS